MSPSSPKRRRPVGRTPRNPNIQGIGAGFIPKILNRAVIDEVAMVSEDAAFRTRGRHSEEILAGISSGAGLAAALVVAGRRELEGKLVVTMVCDTGERYVSTPLMSELVRRA
jgi:cysteine synthase A